MGLLNDMFSIVPADENRRVLLWKKGVQAFGTPTDMVDDLYARCNNDTNWYFHVCTHDQGIFEDHVLESLAKNPRAKPRGTKKTARDLVALWADIDLNTKDPKYPTNEEVGTAMSLVGFAPSAWVFSGQGWHVYWLFTHPLDARSNGELPQLWQSHLRKALFDTMRKSRGVEPDEKVLDVTSDIARVLRVDGTKNGNVGDPNLAMVSYMPADPIPRHDPASIIAFLQKQGVDICINKSARAVNQALARGNEVLPFFKTRQDLPLFATVKEPRVHLDESMSSTIPASQVLRECAQMHRFEEKRGNVSEPEWYSAAGVLAYCSGGPEAFVSISQQAEQAVADVSESNSWRKLDQWRENSTGAASCARVRKTSGDPRLCDDCPYDVDTPLSAKPDGAMKVSQVKTIEDIPEEEVHAPIVEASGDTVVSTNPALGFTPKKLTHDDRDPDGYKRIDGLLYVTRKRGKGDPEDINVCGNNLKVVADVNNVDPNTGTIERAILVTSDNHPDPVAVPASAMVLPAIESALESVLGDFRPGDHASSTSLLLQYFKSRRFYLQRNNKLINIPSKYGWHHVEDDATREFRYGNVLVRQVDGQYHPITIPGMSEDAKFSQYKRTGDPQRWVEAVSPMLTPVMAPHLTAFLGAFAAPLMRMLDFINGGAIIMQGDSGVGKTLVLSLINSTMTDPKQNAVTGSDTKAATTTTQERLNDLPVTMDEVTSSRPDEFFDMLLHMSGSTTRRKFGGDHRIIGGDNDIHRLAIMTSNVSLAQMAASRDNSRKDREAEMNRALEIHITYSPELQKHLTSNEHLFRQMSGNYGFAMHLFLARVAKDYAAVKERVNRRNDQLRAEVATLDDAGQRYRAGMVACILTAADLVHEMGLMTITGMRESIKEVCMDAIDHSQGENLEELAIESMIKAMGVDGADKRMAKHIMMLNEFLREHDDRMIIKHGTSVLFDPQTRGAPIGKYNVESVNGAQVATWAWLHTKAVNDWLRPQSYETPSEIQRSWGACGLAPEEHTKARISGAKRSFELTRSSVALGKGTRFKAFKINMTRLRDIMGDELAATPDNVLQFTNQTWSEAGPDESELPPPPIDLQTP